MPFSLKTNTMETWKFIRDGKEELVEPEVWQWQAVYTDGSVLKQFDDNGYFHRFREIDQSRLFAFKMVSPQFTFTILWEKGMKLIHYYENYLLNDGKIKIRLYCFGYQKGKEKRIFVILPNNEMVITDDSGRVKTG